MKLEIYNRKNAYNREIIRLKEEKISQRNKDLISIFHNHLFSKDIGELRVVKLSTILRKMALITKKDYDKLTKEELILLLSSLKRNTSFSDETKADYRKAIKQFYRWFKEEDPRLESEDFTQIKKMDKFYIRGVIFPCNMCGFLKNADSVGTISHLLRRGFIRLSVQSFSKRFQINCQWTDPDNVETRNGLKTLYQ